MCIPALRRSCVTLSFLYCRRRAQPLCVLLLSAVHDIEGAVSCPAGGGLPCFGHGACYTTGARANTCLCEPGYSGVDATNRSSCDDCDASYWGNAPRGANLQCSPCPATTLGICHGHGTCSAEAAGNGQCVCDPGFEGAKCEIHLPCASGASTPAIVNCTKTCSLIPLFMQGTTGRSTRTPV